jgi:hypothetical protein
MQEFVAQAADTLLPIAATLLTALVSWGLTELAKYVRSRTKNEAVNGALQRICHMADTTVAELNQTVADGLRAAAADGKITPDERAALKAQAVGLVQSRLAPEVIKAAAQGVTDITEFISARIERSVWEQKNVIGIPTVGTIEQAQAPVGM